MRLFDDLKAVGFRHNQRNAIEQLLLSAIAEDPDFAMAHLKLALSIGQAINVYGKRDDAAAHATRALALSGRLAEDERLQIVAWANLVLGLAANSNSPAGSGTSRRQKTPSSNCSGIGLMTSTVSRDWLPSTGPGSARPTRCGCTSGSEMSGRMPSVGGLRRREWPTVLAISRRPAYSRMPPPGS